MKTVIGVILFLVAIIWGAILAWSNPDMTNRRLWLEYPGEVAGVLVIMIVGYVLIYADRRK